MKHWLAAPCVPPCPVCKGSRLNETASNVLIGDHSINDFTRAPAGDSLGLTENLRFTGPRAGIAKEVVSEIQQRLKFLAKVGLDYLSLDRSGFARVGPITDQILEALKAGGGHLPYNDESPPDAIRTAFGVSKKAFKQAVGTLYRKRLIELTTDGISLVKK